MSKLKETQMEEWLMALEVITQHMENEDDTVLKARSRLFNRATVEAKKLIEGWLACDQAHSNYTGL